MIGPRSISAAGISPASSATFLVEQLRAGRVPAVELLEFYIARVELYDEKLGSVAVKDYERARTRAREADAARLAGKFWGPLHGLPMLVKDSNDVEGLSSCKGIPEQQAPAKHNSTAVQRLLDAGVIIFGKTNTPVACLDWEAYNPVYGATCNPWNDKYSPGGSSGGSCAALAAGLTPLELGSDVAGSIRVPASFCGVFGLSPSYDVVPYGRLGQELGNKDLVVTGPIARTVPDLQLAFSVLASASMPEEGDGKPEGTESHSPEIALLKGRGMERAALREYRVAVWESDECCKVGNDVAAEMKRVADHLVAQGASVHYTKPELAGERSYTAYLKLLGGKKAAPASSQLHQTLQGKVSEFEDDDKGVIATYWRAATQSHGDWIEANGERFKVRASCANFFRQFNDNSGTPKIGADEDKFDVLLMPNAFSPAFPSQQPKGQDAYTPGRTVTVDGVERPYSDYFFWPHLCILAGLPSVAVPTGFSANGLPVGIQVMGPSFGDYTVLHFAKLLSESLGSDSLGLPEQFS